MRDQLQFTVLSGSAPHPYRIATSVAGHLAILALIFVFRHGSPIHISIVKVEKIERRAGVVYLSTKTAPGPASARPADLKPRRTNARSHAAFAASRGTPGEVLREQAQKATAAITNSIKFHQVYGFYPGADYRLAVQTSGEIPPVAAADVPPHFQQYVIVEITIDTDGHVADAQITAGVVDKSIQEKLLSAIREFKYSPATRDGVPIPSQRDIVIHIPS